MGDKPSHITFKYMDIKVIMLSKITYHYNYRHNQYFKAQHILSKTLQISVVPQRILLSVHTLQVILVAWGKVSRLVTQRS